MNDIKKYRILSFLYALKYNELQYNEQVDEEPRFEKTDAYCLILDLIDLLKKYGIEVSYTETPTQIHTNALTLIKKYQ